MDFSKNTALSGKQDKLTNPLTQADVKNNLTSSDTNKPLSAAQGKALNQTLATKVTSGSLVDSTSSNHNVTFKWTSNPASYFEVYVDGTKVVQLKGFKKYD